MKKIFCVLVISILCLTPSLYAEVEKGDYDNTRHNVMDKDGMTALPEHQSNKKEFLERSSQIRKAILNQEDLSLDAHNIKIITMDAGTVVLRGPVRSTEEKNRVEKIATAIAGRSNVTSFLTVVSK